MARATAVAFLLVVTAAVESAVRAVVPIEGAAPALLAATAVLAALEAGPLVGVRVGFGAGIVADLLSPATPFGLGALVGLAVGFAVGAVRPYLTEGTLAPRVAAVFAGTTAWAVGAGLLGAMLDAGAVGVALVRSALLTGVLSAVAAPALLWPVRALERRFPAAESGMRYGVVRSSRDPYGVRIGG